MPSSYTPGELCCASAACVLIERTCGSDATWDLIPHVTNISTSSAANTPKLVTSSTGGQETSLCGTVSNTGTLSLACHGGTGPGLLLVNQVYHIRWSPDCNEIWDYDECTPQILSGNPGEPYLEAYIRITTTPLNYNISGNQAIIYDYAFDIVSWVHGPAQLAQAGCGAVPDGFVHC